MGNTFVEESSAPLSPKLHGNDRIGTAMQAGSVARFALVIDDQEEICRLVATTLAELGIEVGGVPIGKARDRLAQPAAPGDYFLDVALDQSDAIDVIKGLSDKKYTGTVQLMSGSRPSLLEAIQRIAKRYGLALCPPLQKPVTADAVRAVTASVGLARAARLVLD